MTNRTRQRRSRRLKLFLWLMMIVIIGIVAVTFIRYRVSTWQVQQPDAPEKTQATFSINDFEHTAIKEGVKQWVLTAESAQMYSDINEAILNNMDVIFYRGDDPPVTLSADQGRLDIESRDIWAKGNVVARHPEYRLETESLKYEHGFRIIIIDKPVEISGDITRFRADSARYDINSGEFILEGKVKGWISGKLDL